MCFFFFKQKTAYEMRISDWSSDVCSSDLLVGERFEHALQADRRLNGALLERLALAIGRDLTGARLILDDRERVARHRNAAKAEHLDRHRRTEIGRAHV